MLTALGSIVMQSKKPQPTRRTSWKSGLPT